MEHRVCLVLSVAILLITIAEAIPLRHHADTPISVVDDTDVFPFNYQNISKLLYQSAITETNIDVLAELCDTFGPRYRGTPNLDSALDWIYDQLVNENLDNVRKEVVVNITNWVRGNESLYLVSPRNQKMALLGLGRSVGTPPEGITAEAFVVSSFDDLAANATKAKGKIVVYNAPFVTYDETVQYRVYGASEAAKYGAVAALVRSIASWSLYSPHTGSMRYEDGVPQIPTAAITIEDAEMLSRMQARGNKLILTLNMQAKTVDPVTSYNILAEVTGATIPDEVVVLGGHSDSWDVGQGAMDDGAGLFSAWQAVSLINRLVQSNQIPRPKRTIRLVLWVDEELSQRGAQTYFQDHIHELNQHVIAMESDAGNFDPIGFGFTGVPDAYDTIKLISSVLLAPYGMGEVMYPNQGTSTDNEPLVDCGVPGANLWSTGFDPVDDDPRTAVYFYYHHSNADTMTSLNNDGVYRSVGLFSIMSYVLADMDEKLPNNITCSGL